MGWMRAALGAAVLIFAWRSAPGGLSPGELAVSLAVGAVWLASLIVHVGAKDGGRLDSSPGIVAVFAADLLLVALLIWLGGTPQSPYAALLGLVVIASGLHGRSMPPLALAVLAAGLYVLAVELAAGGDLSGAQALHALLQVSALLLAGGVMGAIARRHQRLARAGDQARRRHRSLRELHEAVMQTMSEGLLVLDAGARVIEANPAARGWLEAEGGRLPDSLASLVAEADPASGARGEVRLHGKVLLATVRALPAGADAAWLMTLVDITHLRELEARLIEQERMAALGQMSAMLAHEIRNPVQTMAQGLELLKLGVPASEADIRAILHEEMLRLNRMVNMMLDYSRPLTPAPREVRPCELIEAAVQQADLAGGRGIEWTCKVARARIDPDHFRLALDNLLHNALANRQGDAPVRLRMEAADGGWRLTVRNAGEIAPSVRERLFEPFASGRASGIGLGLAIVRQVCEANDWEIALDSRDGETCFAITAAGAPRGREEHG